MFARPVKTRPAVHRPVLECTNTAGEIFVGYWFVPVNHMSVSIQHRMRDQCQNKVQMPQFVDPYLACRIQAIIATIDSICKVQVWSCKLALSMRYASQVWSCKLALSHSDRMPNTTGCMIACSSFVPGTDKMKRGHSMRHRALMQHIVIRNHSNYCLPGTTWYVIVDIKQGRIIGSPIGDQIMILQPGLTSRHHLLLRQTRVRTRS